MFRSVVKIVSSEVENLGSSNNNNNFVGQVWHDICKKIKNRNLFLKWKLYNTTHRLVYHGFPYRRWRKSVEEDVILTKKRKEKITEKLKKTVALP